MPTFTAAINTSLNISDHHCTAQQERSQHDKQKPNPIGLCCMNDYLAHC